jgi:hypothetical protein
MAPAASKKLTWIPLLLYLYMITRAIDCFLSETRYVHHYRIRFAGTLLDQRCGQICRFLSTSQSPSDVNLTDYTQEETLLCISMILQPGVALNDALASISKFCQTFPFAAVLPVQPLFYLPVQEDGGVEIKFMRKKTPERSSIDGGIRFFLRSEDNDDGDRERTHRPPTIELTAKRNSNGQVITKVMAEKLVITNFVRSFAAGNQNTTTNVLQFNKTSPTVDCVHIKSMYHKWM